MAAPGTVVAWWDGNHLSYGVVAAEEKGRLRLVLPGGGEQRVAPSRVAFTLGRLDEPPGKTLEERRKAGAAAAEIERRLGEAATSVDVALVWELATEPDEPPGIAALSELALGSADDTARATLTRALIDDGIHFVRKGVDWEPRTAATVEEILRQRETTARKGLERDSTKAALAAVVRGERFEPSGSGEEKRYLAALEELAVRDLGASETARSMAMEILEASGQKFDRPAEGAFRLLRRIGRFESDDENLQIVRYGLRTEFPVEVLEAAEIAAGRGFAREDRVDLTHLETITIDGPSTREIDDGLSLESRDGGEVVLGIHIADPASFVEPGGVVDREAAARTVTVYLPEIRLPMIPPVLSEEAASLVEGEDRPALSFLVTLDAAGSVVDYEIARSIVRSRVRLDYDEVDEVLASGRGEWFALVHALAEAGESRERARVRDGAVLILAPEVDVHVDETGAIRLERIEPDSASHRIVSESMILGSAIAARFCAAHGLPAIHRRQPAPERALELSPEGIAGPVEVRAARRSLRRGEVGLQPGPHYALGLDAYAQATSPLRRYQDLATHRQISSVLRDRPPVYDEDSLQRVAASTEAAEIEGRRAESDAGRYWLLRYLQGKTGEVVEGVVVEVEPRPVVLLEETLIEHPMRGLSDVAPGDRVRLSVERVNPRADLLFLRPAS